jgi:hypothetical protein
LSQIKKQNKKTTTADWKIYWINKKQITGKLRMSGTYFLILNCFFIFPLDFSIFYAIL